MFTGIVEELGEVLALEPLGGAARLTVNGPKVVHGVAHGDSISVNGVCLTVTAASGTAFSADVMGETLRRSDIGTLAPGSPVNLERPLPAGGRLGGHLVQGHVDGTGRIVSRTPAPQDEPDGPTARSFPQWEVVRITLPNGLARYVAEKGSVAVDGVSLTVSAIGDASTEPRSQPWFEVSLIPATLQLTTLGRKQPGELVNLEVDVVAKYVEKLLDWRQR